MDNYHNFISEILRKGQEECDRTGVGTKYLFGKTLRFDLQDGFPLCTTRKMYFQGIVDELLWMLSGSTHVDDLPERTRQIWDQDEWKKEGENLGPSYGKQFRRVDSEITSRRYWSDDGFDQLQNVIDNIQQNPNSRRHVISLWQQPDMSELPLPCCHGTKIQFNVRKNKYLDCHMDARSQDVMVGMPWNIAFYSLLIHMIANVTDYRPGNYIHTGGNCHIYKNHIKKARKQIKRDPYPKPKIGISDKDDIDSYDENDFELKDYHYHSKIDYPVAV